MGSFNTSCFVSRQTIAPRDPVIIIPIAQQKSFTPITFSHNEKTFQQFSFANSGCYPTRFWKPVGPFFHATYDDYGCVAIANTPLNLYKLLIFIQSCLQNLPLVVAGTNEYHDLPLNLPVYLSETAPELLSFLQSATTFYAPPPSLFDQAHACWDHIYEVAQEYRAFWFDYGQTPRPLSYAICHLHAYTELIELTNSFATWSGTSNEMRTRFDQVFDSLQTVPASVPPHLRTFHSMRALEKLFNFAQHEGSGYPGEDIATDDILNLCNPDLPAPDYLFDLIKPWLEPHYACAALLRLNIHFEPIVYATQDYSNEIGSAYASFVANVSSKVNTERKISQYGEPTTYSLLIATDLLPPLLQSITAEIDNWDAYLDVLSSTPHPSLPNLTTLTFNTSQDLEDLQEFLEELTAELTDLAQQDANPESPYPYSLQSLTQLTNTSPTAT